MNQAIYGKLCNKLSGWFIILHSRYIDNSYNLFEGVRELRKPWNY